MTTNLIGASASTFLSTDAEYFGYNPADLKALSEMYTSAEEQTADSVVRIDTMQFLGLNGVNHAKVTQAALASMRTTFPDVTAYATGTIFDVYSAAAFQYAESLGDKLSQLNDQSVIDASWKWSKPFHKRRQQLRIDSDIQSKFGITFYNVSTRFIDVLTGTTTEWKSTDMVNGVVAQRQLIVRGARTGFINAVTQKFHSLLLGDVAVMDLALEQCRAIKGIELYQSALQSGIEALTNPAIRYENQLVFYTVMQAIKPELIARRRALSTGSVQIQAQPDSTEA